MSDVPVDHPLVGTWITEDEDSDVAFVFCVVDDVFSVSGFCRSTGEPFDIIDTSWDGKALRFTARFTSTGTLTKNVFRLQPDGRAELELTHYEIWKKKDATLGELPEGWRSQLQVR